MSKRKPGFVYLVGAGPGDPGLLTRRGAELLARADVILHDALVNPTLLQLAPAGADIIDAGKRGPRPTLSQEDVHRFLVDHARAGRTVVRLKGGDPYVFGRGAEEACHLAAAGIPFEVVPGVSSFSAVPACAGIPLTHRGMASSFTVVTGHQDPTRPEATIDWTDIARVPGTKVVLMGVERLEAITAALQAGGLAGTTPAALIQWGSTHHQRTLVASLADLAARASADGFAAPAVAVIGDVVTLRGQLNWFETRPLFGRRIVVTRTREQAGLLAARLSELGADLLEIPTIRIQPPTEPQPMIEALAGLGEYDWVVFTSPNGVTAFFDALLGAFDDIRALGNLRLAAVGPATADRLKALHLRADVIPDEHLGRNLAKAMAAHESLENLRVLLARAQVASPDIVQELENQGAIVDDIAFYQTVPESADPGGAASQLLAEGADWITFTSGSTVGNFHTRFDLPALVRRHPQLRLASIGPETTKALAALDLKPAVEARPHTVEVLVQALVAAPAPAHFGSQISNLKSQI